MTYDTFLIEVCGATPCKHGAECGLVAACPVCGCCCIDHECECERATGETPASARMETKQLLKRST